MQIGTLRIKGHAALAPMAGVADRAMRELCRAHGAAYVVAGASMDNLIRSVNFENEDSLNYFHRMLRKWGVIDALREAGAQEGDSVVIGEMEFDFVD